MPNLFLRYRKVIGQIQRIEALVFRTIPGEDQQPRDCGGTGASGGGGGGGASAGGGGRGGASGGGASSVGIVPA